MEAFDLKRDDVISKGRVRVLDAVYSDPAHNSIGLVTLTAVTRTGRLFQAVVEGDRRVDVAA